MRALALLGRAAAWLTTLMLCGGVFAASVAALTAVIENASARAPSEPRYSRSMDAPEVLEAEAFDVRKVLAFLNAPDGEDDPSPLTAAAGLETVRSVAPAAVPAALPTATEAAFAATARVGPSAVNLRAGPSKGATKLATLAPGEELRVVGQSGSWVQVVTNSGTTGWVSARYLGGATETEALTAIAASALGDELVEQTASLAYFDEGDQGAGIVTAFEPKPQPATETIADTSSSESSSGEVRDPAPAGER